MKNSFIILIMVLFTFNSKGQQLKNIDHKFSSEVYLKKSKKQSNTGFILLGGGAALFGIGSYALAHATHKDATGGVIILGGMTMAVTSIPFFISSANNKRKAKLFMNKETLIIGPNTKTNLQYNSIGMRINF